MASRRGLALGAALLCALVSGLWPAGAQGEAHQRQPKRHAVVIEGTSFQPERLTVAAGDTVLWTNKDPFPHTATSSAGAFDSGTIAPEKSWRRTLTRKGEFNYVCSLHPTMKGVVVVQ